MNSHKAITKVFNILLFLYFLFNSFISYLFDSSSDKHVPWDDVYEWSPPLAIAGALIILCVSVLAGAAIAKNFWNRFIVDISKVREITYDEALAIVLLLVIIIG